MNLHKLDRMTVQLLPNQLWVEGSKDMTLFLISDWALDMKNRSSPKEGVRMKIVLKRKIVNELMTTYLPSVLLLLITWMTTFFKPYFFEAALSVNLTTMLVLTTIFIGVMQTLPTTAYIKMIDVWLIFCQLIPFIEVILLTIGEYLRTGDGSGEEQSDVVSEVQKIDQQSEEDEVSTISGQDEVTMGPQTKVAKIPVEAWKENREKRNWVKFAGENETVYIIYKYIFQRRSSCQCLPWFGS